MPTNREIETDVLVIGGGLAGCFAAIKAREMGVKVILSDKAFAGKSGGGAFCGGHIAVFNPEWGHDFDAWKKFILGIGEYVNDQDWIEIILKNSYAIYQDLVSWNIPFMEKGKKIESLHYMASNQITNQAILVRREFMPPIRNKAEERGVEILDRVMITDLLNQDGKVVGAIGFDTRNGDFYTISAKATVIAAGGGAFKAPGGPYHYWTADGEAMAYRAGARITNKEFGGKDVGFPKNLAGSPRALRGGANPHYVNAEGQEFLSTYSTNYQRHHSQHMGWLFEVHAGRGPIYADLDRLSPAEKKNNLESYRLTPQNLFEAQKVGFDITAGGKLEMMAGEQVGYTGLHYGGVVIDLKCASTLPGLYAAGDSAGTRFAGSLYPPTGYGLSGAFTTGYRAGQGAAEFALQKRKNKVDHTEIGKLKQSLFQPLTRTGGFGPSWATEMLRNTLIPYYIMQIKHEKRLLAALELITFIKEHVCPMLRANDTHELRMAQEVKNMALNAEMILRSSLFRKESRGTHYREDYPHRNDPEWLAWSILYSDGGEMKLSKQPIPEKWWPDLSIPYKDRYMLRFPNEL